MSKIFRITVASAVVAGVAALTPLSAQAKTAPELPTNGSRISVESCASAGAADAVGTIVAVPTGWKFTVTVPAIAPGAVYETRARVFTVAANGTTSFSTKRARVSNTSDIGTGLVSANQHIWRLDVSNLTAEAAGLPALAYTSAGFINCD
jgi:hypothetical protein